MTVYADILFLVNFSMDFLTLYLTGRLMHRPMRRVRLIAAAVLGSAGGTMYSLVSEQSGTVGTLISISAGLLLSAVMVLIGFGKPSSCVSLIRDSISVWGAGTLLGGIMTLVLSLGEPVYMSTNNSFLPAFAACFFVSIGLTRFFSSVGAKKSVTVEIEAAGKTCIFEALCDSGSFATEPISGLPVIIVSSTAAREWSEMLKREQCPLKLRMIPIHGIGGESLLRGFIPDSTLIDGRKVEAVIALQDSQGFAGCDAIAPSVLCRK